MMIVKCSISLKKWREAEEWRFLATVDPEEVLGWVRDDEIDILLVDVWMPVVSGYQLVQKARNISERSFS